jgi:hypothetical protein
MKEILRHNMLLFMTLFVCYSVNGMSRTNLICQQIDETIQKAALTGGYITTIIIGIFVTLILFFMLLMLSYLIKALSEQDVDDSTLANGVSGFLYTILAGEITRFFLTFILLPNELSELNSVETADYVKFIEATDWFLMVKTSDGIFMAIACLVIGHRFIEGKCEKIASVIGVSLFSISLFFLTIW